MAHAYKSKASQNLVSLTHGLGVRFACDSLRFAVRPPMLVTHPLVRFLVRNGFELILLVGLLLAQHLQ